MPASDSATKAIAGPGLAGARRAPPVNSAIGSTANAPAPNCTAVTAVASRPSSTRDCATMNTADKIAEASTSRSPNTVAPPPLAPATSAIPPSASPNPDQPSGRTRPCPSAAVVSATSRGTAPTTTAAWLTLVRCTPAFWSRMTPPNPIAPVTATFHDTALRRFRRATSPSTGAATTKRAKVSQAGPSQPIVSLDSGTVRPHSTPAAANAANAVWCLRSIQSMMAAIWDIAN